MDAIHYLRTEEHYRNAPVGTTLELSFARHPAWEKIGPGVWRSIGGGRMVIDEGSLVDVKRRVLHYPASGA